MEKSYYLSTTFNEVVFSNRNKVYGAYELRREYGRNIKVAIICGTLLFAGALLVPILKAKYLPPAIEADQPVIKDEGYVVEIIPEVQQPKVEEQIAAASKEKVKTEVYSKPKVVPDNANVKDVTLANQEDLKNAAFGKEKIEGVPLTTPEVLITDAPSGLDAGADEAPANGIFIHAEEMPEFIGGERAMLQYIGRKVKYPGPAQKENIQGLVVVTFVVAPTGEIRDAEVVKGLGYGTDEEALRVVKSMPKWKPGKQNGKPVAVRYTLPIRFSMR